MSARWIVTSAIILGLSMGSTQVHATPGQPLGRASPAPFRLSFDEYGDGFIQMIRPNGSLGPAFSNPGFVSGGFLTYHLPDLVGGGDVAIAGPGEPCTSAADCSDGLRFYNGDFMQYFSQPEVGPPVLADTGFPADFNFSRIGATETGMPGVLETFTFGGGHPGANEYFGVSDGRLPVPEPATLVLLSTALLGLGAALRQRRGSGR